MQNYFIVKLYLNATSVNVLESELFYFCEKENSALQINNIVKILIFPFLSLVLSLPDKERWTRLCLNYFFSKIFEIFV